MDENAWLSLHNASLEGPELFGPPQNFSSIAPMMVNLEGVGIKRPPLWLRMHLSGYGW